MQTIIKHGEYNDDFIDFLNEINLMFLKLIDERPIIIIDNKGLEKILSSCPKSLNAYNNEINQLIFKQLAYIKAIALNRYIYKYKEDDNKIEFNILDFIKDNLQNKYKKDFVATDYISILDYLIKNNSSFINLTDEQFTKLYNKVEEHYNHCKERMHFIRLSKLCYKEYKIKLNPSLLKYYLHFCKNSDLHYWNDYQYIECLGDAIKYNRANNFPKQNNEIRRIKEMLKKSLSSTWDLIKLNEFNIITEPFELIKFMLDDSTSSLI